MAWRTEGEDLVFDGWENGTAESPFTGHTLVRNVNIVDSPKEFFVNYDLIAQSSYPQTCSATSDDTTDLVTYTRATDPVTGTQKVAIMTGTPVVFTGTTPVTTGPASLLTNRIYYAVFESINSTTGTFKIATTLANALAGTTIDLVADTVGTNVTPVGPAFSGFSGASGQIAPYPATYVDASGVSYQYMGDSTGSENGSIWKGVGNLWYYIGTSSSKSGWSILDPGTALVVSSVDAGTDRLTMPANTTFATGTAVVLSAGTAGTMPAGLTAGTTYYAINVSATELELATTLANALAGTQIDITSTGSGTINIMFAEGVYGLAANWGYVFVFRNYQIDVFNISTNAWVIGWKTNLTSPALSHRAIPAQDDAIYFCNDDKVGSILQNAGQTFAPGTAATYTYNTAALQLPFNESAISLAELGTNLLVGGVFNKIYPWDRLSTGTLYPLLCPEQNIAEMVTVNTTTYIGAGYRGRVYQTNGASVDLFKKFPDHIAGEIQPLFYWKCFGTTRNRLYVSVETFDNSGATIGAANSSAGLFSIDFDSQALVYEQTFSTGLSNSMTNMFAPFLMPVFGGTQSGGQAFLTGWTLLLSGTRYSGFDGFVGQNSSTTGGTPDGAYLSGAAQVLTDLVRVGGTYTKKTFSQVEWLLSVPLTSGERVKIEARSFFDGSFTTVDDYTATGTGSEISNVVSVSFQNYVWIQFRITLYSVGFASDPSYVRFVELRVR